MGLLGRENESRFLPSALHLINTDNLNNDAVFDFLVRSILRFEFIYRWHKSLLPRNLLRTEGDGFPLPRMRVACFVCLFLDLSAFESTFVLRTTWLNFLLV